MYIIYIRRYRIILFSRKLSSKSSSCSHLQPSYIKQFFLIYQTSISVKIRKSPKMVLSHCYIVLLYFSHGIFIYESLYYKVPK